MGKKLKSTTVYSLSKELSVSVATVSKALRGSPEISATVRKKVLDHATKQNFTPRLISKKVPNICVLIQQYPGHSLDFGMFLSMVMEGVAEYVQEEGIEMSIYADSIDKLNKVDLIRELRRRSIDGAIVLRSNDESAYFKQLDAEKFPHCALLSSTPGHSGHEIIADNAEVGRKATSYLLKKGHRKIGVMVSPPSGVSGQTRLEGYCSALAEAGMDIDDDLIVWETSEKTGLQFGVDGIQELVQRNPTMTAVFAMDHSVTVGLLHGLEKIGKIVPRDISVISCDDYPQSAFLNPPLTVVDIPNRKLGHLAAKQVHRLIRGLKPITVEDFVDLSGHIIARESVRVLSPRELVMSLPHPTRKK